MELDDGGSLEHLEECDLAVGSLLVPCIHVVQVHFLQSILLPVDDVLVQEHASGRTLANGPNLLILVNANELFGLN